MSWDLETEPAFQAKLDWADQFVREEVEPLDLIRPGLQFTPPDERLRKVLDPLKAEVRDRDVWATHLGPALGVAGHGQLHLSLLTRYSADSGRMLREHQATDDLWPTQHIPKRLDDERAESAEHLEHEVSSL